MRGCFATVRMQVFVLGLVAGLLVGLPLAHAEQGEQGKGTHQPDSPSSGNEEAKKQAEPPEKGEKISKGETREEQQAVSYSIAVSPKDVSIGKRFTLTIALTYPPGTKVYFPENPDTGPFVLLDHQKELPPVVGAWGKERTSSWRHCRLRPRWW